MKKRKSTDTAIISAVTALVFILILAVFGKSQAADVQITEHNSSCILCLERVQVGMKGDVNWSEEGKGGNPWKR